MGEGTPGSRNPQLLSEPSRFSCLSPRTDTGDSEERTDSVAAESAASFPLAAQDGGKSLYSENKWDRKPKV